MTHIIRNKRCRHGAFFYNINDTFVGKSLHLYGEWAASEVHLFEQIVRPGDVVLEAGSNLGSHTVPLAQRVGAAGQVLAFEPQQAAFQLLCANLAANGLVNTVARAVALGAAAGTASFPDPPADSPNNFGSASVHSLGDKRVLVPRISIDSMALPRLDFLKADIEGGESELLEGASETIARCRPIAFIETVNPYTGDCSAAITRYFVDWGYRCWHYITPLFNAENFERYPHDEFKGLWSFDVLCIPPEKGVAIGLADAQTHPAHCDDPDLWRNAQVHLADAGFPAASASGPIR